MNLSKTFKWRIQKDNVDQVTYESSLENKISNPIKHPNPEYLTDINTSYKKVETITGILYRYTGIPCKSCPEYIRA